MTESIVNETLPILLGELRTQWFLYRTDTRYVPIQIGNWSVELRHIAAIEIVPIKGLVSFSGLKQTSSNLDGWSTRLLFVTGHQLRFFIPLGGNAPEQCIFE